MFDILSKRHARTLAEFASSNVLLAFDYDGTLASIAGRPEEARISPSTRRLLTAISIRYPCIVISGRSWSDVAERIAGIPVWHVFGNHGVEPWSQNPGHAVQVRKWVRHLRRRLIAYPGLVIEDKTYSVAIHYRHVREKRRVRLAIDAVVGDLPGTRAVGGREAVNLLPAAAPHKGAALEHARQILACDCSIYVGDDATDEDAFNAAGPERQLSIRVGRLRSSGARYCIKSQVDIDSLLRSLIAARPLRRAGAV